MEEVFSQEEKEVMEEESKRLVGKKRRRVRGKELTRIECGEELSEVLSGCDDPVLLGMWSKQQVKAEEAKKVRVVDSQDCSGMVTVETWPDVDG